MDLPPVEAGVPALPADIYGEIFRREPSLLRQSQQISKSVGRATKFPYLEQVCNQPISDDEYKNYLRWLQNQAGEQKVAWFGWRGPDRPSEMFALTYLKHEIAPRGPSYTTKYLGETADYPGYIYVSPLKVQYTESSSVNSFEDYYNALRRDGTIKFYDLLSTYQVLSHRLDCQRLDPKFAGNWVRREFEQIVHTAWSPNPLYARMQLYLYLVTNAFVLNIPAPDGGSWGARVHFFSFAPDEDPEAGQRKAEQLEALINYLIHAIRRKINDW